MSVRIGLPLLNIGFFWNPGRVSWIHRGAYVGWVPLAPREMYYSHRNWGGPHTVVVTNVNIAQININMRNYAYVNHAVVVNQNNFSRVNNYRDVRVTNINRTTIINNYQAAPVVNNTVINNYTTNKQRYNYTNITAKEKPHNTVINRIQHNETIIRGGRKENAAVLQERTKSIKQGTVSREARIEPPKSTNYIVPANQVNRPKSEITLPQREIKGSGRGAQEVRPGQAGRPERVSPAKPAQSEKERPKLAAPARPGQQEKTGQPPTPERASPAKSARPKQPAARSERVTPGKVGPEERRRDQLEQPNTGENNR
jgi:hypothetical protein